MRLLPAAQRSIYSPKCHYALMSRSAPRVPSLASCCEGRYGFTAEIKNTQKIPETDLTLCVTRKQSGLGCRLIKP